MWPTREMINKHMPEQFKEKYPSTRILIDCTEVKCQMPCSLRLNSEYFRHPHQSQKNCTCFKYFAIGESSVKSHRLITLDFFSKLSHRVVKIDKLLFHFIQLNYQSICFLFCFLKLVFQLLYFLFQFRHTFILRASIVDFQHIRDLLSISSFIAPAVTSPHVELVFAFAAFAVLVPDSFATIFRSTRLLFFRDFLFTGEPYFQKNIDGTAVCFKLFLRPASDVR